MREIEIDGKEVRVRANPLALLYYKQEFRSDLIADFVRVSPSPQKTEDGQSLEFDSVIFLQIVWAMAKADKPSGFPSFVKWLEGLGSFDFGSDKTLGAVVEEATDGFFRSARELRPG